MDIRNRLLNHFEKPYNFHKIEIREGIKDPVILCGKGVIPGESLHIGHFFNYFTAKKIADFLNTEIFCQISDEEKFFTRDNSKKKSLEFESSIVRKQLEKIFSDTKVTYFINSEGISSIYKTVCRLLRMITPKILYKIFGYTENYPLGALYYPIVQLSYALYLNKDLLIITFEDQARYFKSLARKLNKEETDKFSFIFLKPLPSCTKSEKMSATSRKGSIFLNESPDQIKRKIMKMPSKGAPTLEEQKKASREREFCRVLNLLLFFVKESGRNSTREKYISGELSTKELKIMLIENILSIKKEYGF